MSVESLDLAARRRRIMFRAGHRGLRELDLLLGSFVQAELDGLDEADIADFETLLDVPDQTVLDWLLLGVGPDPAHDTPVWRRLAAFHRR